MIGAALRNRLNLLTAACALVVADVFIEKGLDLILPGQTPDMLGEVYRYQPSLNEVLAGLVIWGIGALCFTLMTEVSVAVMRGELRYRA